MMLFVSIDVEERSEKKERDRHIDIQVSLIDTDVDSLFYKMCILKVIFYISFIVLGFSHCMLY